MVHCDTGHEKKWCKLHLVLKLYSGFYHVYGKTVKTSVIQCIELGLLIFKMASLLYWDQMFILSVYIGDNKWVGKWHVDYGTVIEMQSNLLLMQAENWNRFVPPNVHLLFLLASSGLTQVQNQINWYSTKLKDMC